MLKWQCQLNKRSSPPTSILAGRDYNCTIVGSDVILWRIFYNKDCDIIQSRFYKSNKKKRTFNFKYNFNDVSLLNLSTIF